MEGFKCYSERVTINDIDRSFTAITGMNGSGKSNIIDAIIFCLDLNTSKSMRANSYKELINVHKSSATVTLCLCEVPSYGDVEVSRFIDANTNKFKINRNNCTKTTIDNLCKSMGISNDFIIMQGHITKILNMKANDLKMMIENVAGIKCYNEEKEKSLQLLGKKEFKLKSAQEHLRQRIGPFFDQIKNEKQIYQNNEKIEKMTEIYKKEHKSITDVIKRNETRKVIHDIRAQIKDFYMAKNELELIKSKYDKFNNLKLNDISDIKSKINDCKIQMDELDSQLDEERLSQLLNDLEKIPRFEKKYNKEDLLEKESILTKQIGNDLSSNRLEELDELKSKLTELEIRGVDEVLMQKTLNRTFQLMETSIPSDESLQLQKIQGWIIEMTQKDAQKKQLENEYNTIKSRLNYPLMNGVYGTVDENFSLKDEKYREAIFTIMGGKAKHIICVDDSIAANLLKFTNKKISCIPLNKITYCRRPLPFLNAVDCINVLDRDIEPAFLHVFGSYFIIENKKEALKCCFDNKVICVTLDGTVYDPRGTLTGGKIIYRSEIFQKSDLKELEKKISDLKVADESKKLEVIETNRMLKEFINSNKQITSLKSKISLLENICSNKVDLRIELSKIRNDVVEAAKEEEEIGLIIQKRMKLENEVNPLRKKIQDNLLRRERVNVDYHRYLNTLKEYEVENTNQRLSVHEMESLDVKKAQLIKSTVRLQSSITKRYNSIKDDIESWHKENTGNNLSNVDKKALLIGINDDCNSKIFPGIDLNVIEDDFGIMPEILCENLKLLDGNDEGELNAKLFELNENLSQKKGRITMNPSNFELLERNSAVIRELEDKLVRLESDKIEIVKSIETLSLMGVQENRKTFNHINSRLKVFLAYFIKNSDIYISEDFEIKVKIGVWKNSLSELSGGQRSIIALCLIFSMLAYKPAPFYIFDEIDSALDLSFTEHIGSIIQNEFNNAQFIVISLKNNMYDNANKIFKVFIEEHRSKVTQIK